MIRIVTSNSAENLIEDWGHLSNDLPLQVYKEFKERAFDGSSIFNVLELSVSFVLGVSSGMLANWLGSVLKNKKAEKLKIGRKTFVIPSDDDFAKSEIITAIRSEIEELKRLNSESKGE